MSAKAGFLQNEWTHSIAVHVALGSLVVIWILLPQRMTSRRPPIKIEIKEVLAPRSKPEIQVQAPPLPRPKSEPKRVFGLNKNTLTSAKPGGVEVKAGNTIAKAIDNEKAKDTEALPVPTEEYLISQMPRLKGEVRIPYPAEAKAKNIEGTVVMDVLIDDQGKVRSASVIEGPGYGLNEAAMKAIYDFSFAPALMDGKSVAVRIRYAYKFVLN